MKSTSVSQSTSTASKALYRPLIGENHLNVRVRRAFIWIKIDKEVKNKKSIVFSQYLNKKQRLKGIGHRSTLHHFFRLWVFHIAEPTSVRYFPDMIAPKLSYYNLPYIGIQTAYKIKCQ